MIIGLIGNIGSGKTTAAQFLVKTRGFTKLSFADPLKTIATDIGWDGNKDETGRKLLQNLGVAVRQHLGEDTWAMALGTKIQADPNKNYVIDDCRFQNEALLLKWFGAVLVKIERDGHTGDGHISERDLDGFEPDVTLTNNGTEDEFLANIDSLYREIEENQSKQQDGEKPDVQ